MNEQQAFGLARGFLAAREGRGIRGRDVRLVSELTVHPRVFDYLLLGLRPKDLRALRRVRRDAALFTHVEQSILRFRVPTSILGRTVYSEPLVEPLRKALRPFVDQPGFERRSVHRAREVNLGTNSAALEAYWTTIRRMWQDNELAVDFPRTRDTL